MKIIAPAKLNLFLHITGRRSDGYHNLQTVFQFIDFYDELEIAVRDDEQIIPHFQIPGVPLGDDLVTRAAKLLQAKLSTTLGADLYLKKNLPSGAGIGGGSSDAASALLALNQLWHIGLSQDSLMQLGLQLGADVPIFIYGHAAWAEGVGEALKPIDLPEPWYVLLNPNCPVSTKEIFQHPDLTRDADPITIRDFLEGRAENHCQPLVERLYPQVARALRILGEHGPACMSGTGSSVFLTCSDIHHAQKVVDKLPSDLNARIVKGLNQSPVMGWLKI